MAAVEGPGFQDWPIAGSDELLALGEFVLLSIDPVASVAHLDDAIATDEASRLERVVYLAIVMAIVETGLEVGESYRLALHFYLVGQGLPTDAPLTCAPIVPATDYPDARAPLEFNAALPWDDLYVHMLYDFKAVASRFHSGPNALAVRIGKDTKRSLRRYRHDDHATFQEHVPGIGFLEHTPSYQLQAIQALEGVDIDDLESLSDMSNHKSIASESTGAGIRRKMGETCPHVELWLDINDDPRPQRLGNPKDFQASLWAVKKIWQDWELRATTEMLAKRPATTSWLRGTMDADAPEVSPLDSELEVDPTDDDGSACPDDAIEDRIERPKDTVRL
ncbi:hypothetical protein EXIGLDRAFT_737305 [Exidia glandulosa HHB12029]|uniref:Uncharacterized protein n=1 Tax=Exidia glandulosa HHB12029 TaxID=1314781 RepID=A0A165J0W1_EXIGL|nr:hypothetical protein EXIGLDRAFT_737305 [Exidia glandulosa HHB12029]